MDQFFLSTKKNFMSLESYQYGQQNAKDIGPEWINRKGVTFHGNNTRPHPSLVPHQKLLQFEWDILSYLSYLADLTLSDYYLFRFLQFFLTFKPLFQVRRSTIN